MNWGQMYQLLARLGLKEVKTQLVHILLEQAKNGFIKCFTNLLSESRSRTGHAAPSYVSKLNNSITGTFKAFAMRPILASEGDFIPRSTKLKVY